MYQPEQYFFQHTLALLISIVLLDIPRLFLITVHALITIPSFIFSNSVKRQTAGGLHSLSPQTRSKGHPRDCCSTAHHEFDVDEQCAVDARRDDATTGVDYYPPHISHHTPHTTHCNTTHSDTAYQYIL